MPRLLEGTSKCIEKPRRTTTLHQMALKRPQKEATSMPDLFFDVGFVTLYAIY
jgi:hypothetical protein